MSIRKQTNKSANASRKFPRGEKMFTARKDK